jgi:CRISPR-associated protein Csb2
MGSLPIGRNRQPRQFPAAVPASSTLFLRWDRGLPAELRSPLEQVCGLVTYLGHSASPVRVWVTDEAPEPSLIPDDDEPIHRLRMFPSGRLQYLKNRFDAGLRPQPSLWQGYAEPKTKSDTAKFEEPYDPSLIVLRHAGGRKLSLESCGMVADAIRKTLMKRHEKRYGENAPEWLSGHAQDGAPSTMRRPTYLPLGFVGFPHADGHLLGVAIAIPRDFSEDRIKHLFHLLGDHEGKDDIEPGVPFLSLNIQDRERNRSIESLDLVLDEANERNPKRSLRPSTWCAASKLWVTATPLVMPRVPRRALTAEDVVARACTEAGYPEPIAVRVSQSPLLSGAAHTRSFQFPFDPKSHRPRRPITHAEIEFAQPIRGPVIIGAGRYAGYGLCRPMFEGRTP